MTERRRPYGPRDWRSFGALMAVAFPTMFVLIAPGLHAPARPIWPWLAAASFALLAAFVPSSLRFPHRAWMALAETLGRINSRILLTFVWLVVFTPLAFVLRRLRPDPLHRSFDPTVASYRQRPGAGVTLRDMRDPF